MAHRLDILSETEDNITGTGGRGAERSTNGPFLAIRNYFETQVEIKALRRGDMNIIKIIENEVVSWNEETLNLTLSTSENNIPEKRMISVTSAIIAHSTTNSIWNSGEVGNQCFYALIC